MNYKNIIYETKSHVAKITLNRPNVLNAFTAGMWREISTALDVVEQDREIRVLVFTGSGKAFSVGADLKSVKEMAGNARKIRDYLQRVHNTLAKIENLKKPVIAAVNGLALAGGFELMLACDIVLAAQDAKLGDQHAHYALVPGAGGSQRTPRIIGIRRAMEHLLTGDWYSAQEAEKIGLVNHVVPYDELEEAVEKMTAKLINKSPVGSAIIKDLVHRGMNTDLTTALNLELAGVVYASLTEDFVEGLSAFEQKRKPRYKGK